MVFPKALFPVRIVAALLCALTLAACVADAPEIRLPEETKPTAKAPANQEKAAAPPATLPSPPPAVEPGVQKEQLADIPLDQSQPFAPGFMAPGQELIVSPLPPARPRDEGVKIAVILPLGSSNPGLRRDAAELRDALQMALFRRRESSLSLIFLDSAGRPEQAAVAAQQAVEAGAGLILGPLLRQSVAAASSIARAAAVPMLAFSNDASLAGGGVYVLGPPPALEVRRMVDFAMRKGLKRFASLAPANPYGRLVSDEMTRRVLNNGGTVTHKMFYDPSQRDFSQVIKTLAPPANRSENRNAPPPKPEFQALMMPALSGQTLRTLAAQLSARDIDQPAVRFLGLSPWNGFTGLEQEPPLVGAWYTAPMEDGWAGFAEEFEANYGHAPSPLAVLAYDGLGVAAFMTGERDSRLAGAVVLTDSRELYGVNGAFRFTPQGFVERPLAIRELTRRGSKTIDKGVLPPPERMVVPPGATGF